MGRVDRSLVKNLVIGYVMADAGKKMEVLRIVATVLDFNQEERTRTGLEGGAGGWLSAWVGGAVGGGGRSRNPSTSGGPAAGAPTDAPPDGWSLNQGWFEMENTELKIEQVLSASIKSVKTIASGNPESIYIPGYED